MPNPPENPVLKVECPKCGAPPGERCVGGKVHGGAAQRRKNDEARESDLSNEERFALYRFACPTCGAKIGRSGKIHGRRLSKAKPKKVKSGSVRAIPGGAVDSNRRRH